jgi:hypothetical protein
MFVRQMPVAPHVSCHVMQPHQSTNPIQMAWTRLPVGLGGAAAYMYLMYLELFGLS